MANVGDKFHTDMRGIHADAVAVESGFRVLAGSQVKNHEASYLAKGIKCSIEDVDIPVDVGTDEGYTIDENFCNRAYSRYMRLKLIQLYDSDALSYKLLRMNGLNSSIRSQRKTGEELQNYISYVTEVNIK